MNKNNFFKEACAINFSLFVFYFFISFNASGMEGVELSDPVEKKIVIQTTHQFYVRSYDDVEFDPRVFSYKLFDSAMSPSVAAMHMLSSWVSKDKSIYESYMSDIYRKHYAKNPNILPFREGVERVKLTRRVDIGRDSENGLNKRTIIEYELFGKGSSGSMFKGTFQFTNDSGWKLVGMSDDLFNEIP